MTDRQTSHAEPWIIATPAHRDLAGRVVQHWDGPPPGREPRCGREAEFRRAERLMAVGIAQIQQKPARFGVAQRCFCAAIRLYAWALGADRRLAFAWDRLGYVHHRLGNDEEAETCYLRSLAIQEESRQESSTWNEVTLLNLATLYRSNGRPALSRSVLESYDAGAGHRLPGVRPMAIAPPRDGSTPTDREGTGPDAGWRGTGW